MNTTLTSLKPLRVNLGVARLSYAAARRQCSQASRRHEPKIKAHWMAQIRVRKDALRVAAAELRGALKMRGWSL